MYKIPPLVNNTFINGLLLDTDPPTLYSLMNSYVNYDKEEKTTIINLPAAFRTYLFDFDYPLNSNLKENFEINFLNHYMMRRIGFETFLTFKIHLKDKLNIIMPKYSKLLLEFNNLDFTGLKERHSKLGSNSKNENNNELTNTTGTTINDNRFSNVPQNEISDIQNGSYMTDYTYNHNNITTGGNFSSNKSNSGTYTETLSIDKGDATDEYIKIQDKITHVFDMIYKELDCLFYQIV